eukprot:jgi/Botrbrau1/289/Bobra.0022s0256.1
MDCPLHDKHLEHTYLVEQVSLLDHTDLFHPSPFPAHHHHCQTHVMSYRYPTLSMDYSHPPLDVPVQSQGPLTLPLRWLSHVSL